MPIEQLIVELNTKLNGQEPEYEYIANASSKYKTQDLRLLLIWAKAVSVGKHIALYLSIIEYFQQVSDKSHLEQFDFGLAQLTSKLSLLEERVFSFNDYLLAQNVTGRARQYANPQAFIEQELVLEKRLEFFNTYKKPIDPLPTVTELSKTNKIVLQINSLMSVKHAKSEFKSDEEQKPTITVTKAIHSRSHAYQLIRDIADYLIELEPHGFTGYVLQKLASLEKTPLSQVIKELPNLMNLIDKKDITSK